MAEQYIPDDVRDFILQYIDSVAQIEAFLLIRSDSEAQWRIPQIAARLYISERDAKEAVDGLCAAGLLGCNNDVYRFEGVSPDNIALIDRLLAAYTRHLIPVTNIIHAKPGRIRSFANAFRFRKGP